MNLIECPQVRKDYSGRQTSIIKGGTVFLKKEMGDCVIDSHLAFNRPVILWPKNFKICLGIKSECLRNHPGWEG